MTLHNMETTEAEKHAGSSRQMWAVSRSRAADPGQLAWRRLRKDRVAMISLVVILLIVPDGDLRAAVRPDHRPPAEHAVPRHRPDESGLPVAPNSEFWLGTDELGRDVLVRIAYGARVSLLVGVVATLADRDPGRHRRHRRRLLRRLRRHGAGPPHRRGARRCRSCWWRSRWCRLSAPACSSSILVIAFFSWASVARIVRGQVLSVREREFVEAARSLGAGQRRIMFIDILPNVLAPVIVYASLLIPVVDRRPGGPVLPRAGPPAADADWGGMISTAQGVYQVAWWYLFFPASPC